MPGEARQERHPVHDHEPVEALRRALRQAQRRRAPVVHDQRAALHPTVVEERLEDAGIAFDRVGEVGWLRGAPEAGQVEGETAAAGDEVEEVVGVAGNAVHVHGGEPALRNRRLAPEQLDLADLAASVGDGHVGQSTEYAETEYGFVS